jgi:cellulose synthase/poly-beta-1,6-N-acetylglucosamine synthase-like glycosyltransferase
MTKIMFASSLLLIFQAYLGYPLSLVLASIFRSKKVKKAPIFPKTTMIITAYNEEQRIGEKLRNTLSLEYPREKLEILVASDGSTDNTNAVVEQFFADGVQLLSLKDRRGKENAQKEAVSNAGGDVLVFSDVATRLEPSGLKEIIFNFADPLVGCVSSEDRVINRDGTPGGEGLYVRYEMWLRNIETKVNSLVGLSGSFFAARREVCEDFSGDMQSDFRTVLNCVKMGLRAVCDPKAIGYYTDLFRGGREFERKVRTVIRGLTVFFRHIQFLNIFKYGLFSYQYFCHKLLRWSVPFLLSLAFISNLALALTSTFFLFALLLQLFFYGLAIYGFARQSTHLGLLTKVPMYFVTVNASILVAWFRFLRGDRIVMWAPSKR